MKTKLRKFGAWLMAAYHTTAGRRVAAAMVCALAFAGANAWGSVAKTADGREFDDLASALAAVSPDNPLAEVDASVWPADKQAWYNGKFYAKFGCCQTSDVANDSALGAANAADSNEPAVIYCRPNATELSYQTHDQLRTSMTIYGNNARFKVAGWQPTVEHSSGSGDDGAHTLKKDITLAFYNLHDGACVWGVRTSGWTVNVVMENCENVRALMINGNKGSDKSTCNYYVKTCTFDRNAFSCGCPVTTTNPGEVIVENCTFKDYNDDYCFNINNKNGGELTVSAKACQFDNCGTSSKSAFRLMGEADGSSVDATLDGVSFANANRAYDIIVGKAEAVSNKAYVKYEIKNTSANIEVYSQNTAELKLGATLDAAKTYVGNNGVPEVVIDVPEPDEVVVKIEGGASNAQKSEKAAAVVSAIAKAADEESLEVRDSGLQAAAKTAEGKLAAELVTALKEKASAEKKEEITSATAVKKTIDVVFKSMTVEAGENVTTTKIAYDVTPKATATLSGGEKVEAKIPNGTFGKINFRMPLTADFAGRWLKVSRTDNGTDFTEVGLFKAQKEGDVDFVQVDADHFSTYMNEITDKIPVAAIGGKGYATLQAAVDAVKEGETISLSVGTIEEDEITLPDTIKNVTIKGAADHASILKNTSLAHRTNGKSFDGLTIDGVVFDGGHFLMIDWGNGSLKNMTFTNNIFRNWSNAENEAPVEFNESATTALNGLTFTGNVVEGCSGSNISGIYGYFTGDIKIEGNVFTEVPFCAALLNIADNDGVADNVVCTNNKIIAPGFNRAAFQIVFYEGTDNVNVTVNGNIFSGMTYELGVNTWGLGANVTADLTGNYFSQGGNGMIYWDGADDVKMSDVANAADLPHANSDSFTYYTGLTPDGEIDPTTLVEVVKPPVAKIGDKGYATLEEALEDAEDGDTIVLLADIELGEEVEVAKTVTIDFDGHSIASEGLVLYVTASAFGLKGAAIEAGEEYYGYAILTENDTVLTVDGENVVDGAIYALAGLSVVGSDADEDLLDVNAPGMYAFEILGDDFAADKVCITMDAARGVIVQEDHDKITIAVTDARLTGGEAVERLIQSWPYDGAIDVTITNSVLTGCGSVMICSDGTSKRLQDVAVTIMDSQLTLAGIAANEAEVLSCQAAYGDATLVIDNSIVTLTQNNDEMLGINVGTQLEKEGHGLAKGIIRNNSRVEVTGGSAGYNIWTWGANNTRGAELDVDHSTLIIDNDVTYGIEAYAWGTAAPTFVNIDSSTVEIKGPQEAILLGMGKKYKANAGALYLNITNSQVTADGVECGIYLTTGTADHAITYTQTDSDVSLAAEGTGCYAFAAEGGSGASANSTSVTVSGGSLDAQGIFAVYGGEKGNLTMNTDASFDGVVQCDDLMIVDGRYAFGPSAALSASNRGVSGGIFSKDIRDCVAEGHVCVPNTDAATKAEYPWAVVPQQLQPTVSPDAEKPTYEAGFPEEKKETEQTQDAIKAQTDNVKDTLASPVVTSFTETNVEKPLFETDGALKSDVKMALCDAVDNMPGLDDNEKEEVKSAINGSGDSNSVGRVQIDLKEMTVGVAMVSDDEVKATLNKASYDVKPILVTEVTITTGTETKTKTVKTEITKELLAGSKVRFRLAVGKEFVGQAQVIHYKEAEKITKLEDYYTAVLGDGDSKYVEIESDEFSPFDVLNANAVQLACKVGDNMYATIADAIAASVNADNTTIVMLADVGSDVTVEGLGKRVINTNGTSFEAVITPGEGMELVKGAGGKRYLAAPKVEVSTGDHTVMPIRGYVASTDDPASELAGDSETTGNKVWQDYVMFGKEGTRVRLTPEIVKAETGSSVVTIKAAGDFELSKPVRSGVAVSFQLLKRDGITGNFAAYGAPSATPEFTVDVSATEKEKKIGPKTFWKIQTIFSCEEER